MSRARRFQTVRDVESAIGDAYTSARLLRSTSEDLRDRIKAIRVELNTRTPNGTRRYPVCFANYASGYAAALDNDLMRNAVEFCYRDAAGAIYSTHRATSHRSTEEFYSSGRGSELGGMDRAFVWKGSDRPFTAWSAGDAS